MSLPNSYIGEDLAKYLDFVNVMAYDMHGSWDAKTGHHAPLYALPSDEQYLSIVSQIRHSVHDLKLYSQNVYGFQTIFL